MRRHGAIDTAIVIPARNESARLPECLRAIAECRDGRTAVMLVANNCDDDTVGVAHTVAASTGLTLRSHECSFAHAEGVGTARRLGVVHARHHWPDAGAILTTDADCVVAPDWIARNRHHLRRVSAVCGSIAPMATERAVFDDFHAAPTAMEARYGALVVAFYRRHRSGPCGLEGEHDGAGGASLAMRLQAYDAVGGFHNLAVGEDRDIVRRLKAAGFAVRHAGDVRVSASCRLEGRAEGGMAAALRARIERIDYLIDEGLPPSEALIAAANRGDLGPWPLHVAPQQRLHVGELVPHIARLERALHDLKCLDRPPVCPERDLHEKAS